ncbi:structural protein P5 [Vibrio scophthalmi]|uniref:structural protein P5 n=1 Tax=Vibrio scophthalmi TaxID=45658 RepID=UPI003872A854
MQQTKLLSLAALAITSSALLYLYRKQSSVSYSLDNFPDPTSDGIFNMDKLLDKVTAPRGIRNNNPGNVEDNGTPWVGRKGNDGRFIIFDRAENGIRAIARILLTYEKKYGINTLNDIISRWAPPVENNTEAYIQHAERELKISRHTPIGEQHKAALIKVIIKHENGQQPYSDKVIYDGIKSA